MKRMVASVSLAFSHSVFLEQLLWERRARQMVSRLVARPTRLETDVLFCENLRPAGGCGSEPGCEPSPSQALK